MSPEEFARTYLPLGDGLYRIAIDMLGSEEEAADAVQDLFLKLWASGARLDAVRDPRSWSFVLMRNMCVDRMRARNGPEQVPVPGGLADELPDEPDERIPRILDAVRSLDPESRRLLRMRLLEDLSYEEIAQQTGRNELALRVAFHRIKNKIKKKI